MILWRTRCAIVSIVLAGLVRMTTGQEPTQRPTTVPQAEWPAYRRDAGLTGFSPLVGGLTEAPRSCWAYDLGGAIQNTEQVQLVDLNGDGSDELLRVLPDRLICQSVRGETLWETERLSDPQVIQIRDFAGDGTRGVLLASNTGVADHRYLVSGTTGKATLLYTCQNVFGRYERFGKLLEDIPGEQLCAWWSGDTEKRFGGNDQYAAGYLWSFERGVDEPTLRFHVEEEGTIYAPLHLFADMDGDGDTDVVMISHEAMWVYDLASGERSMHSTWGPQIRTYWAATAAVPLVEGELPSLLMINPMIPGVQVVTQNGKTAQSKWKRVVGNDENQYQSKVQIDRAAPDPFIDLDGDGTIEILAAVTNEHADEKVHLVIYRAHDGERVYDQAEQAVITIDELDGLDPPEVLLREGENSLRICHWTRNEFVDLWRGENVSPLVMTPPSEGKLSRAVGARSSSKNMPLWRSHPAGKLFLLQFQEGVWGCRLENGSLERVQRIENHTALAPPLATPRDYSWDGTQLTVLDRGKQRVTYQVPSQQKYLAPAPVVGMLGGSLRILVREYSGALISLAADGSDRRVLLEKSPPSLGVCLQDLDGDGQNEVLAPEETSDGSVEIVVIDAAGTRKYQIASPKGATETNLGPTGTLGADGGRWFVVRYRIEYENTRVVAYQGATGRQLWMRDFLGPERIPSTKFVLHLPTAVYDVDRDGADDLIASSENWYEAISVKDNRSLTPTTTITAAVPGHWGAYATPIVSEFFPGEQPLVFHNNAYALSLLTKLDGTPVWHYGLSRDTTHASLAGLADLDGSGTVELVTTQKDGLLRAFNAKPVAEKCPTCPPDQPLTFLNHRGEVRWTYRLPSSVSDFATLDADADGRVEFLCGCRDGKLYALKETEGECQILWDIDLGANVGAPIVVDLDHDRSPEILVVSADGRLNCLGQKLK